MPNYCMESSNQQVSINIPADILKYIIEQYLINLENHPEDIFKNAIALSRTNKQFNTLVKEVISKIIKKAKYVNIQDFIKAAQIQEEAAYENLKASAISSNNNNPDALFALKFWKKIELEDKYKNKNIISNARLLLNLRSNFWATDYYGKDAELKSIILEILKEESLDERTVKWLSEINHTLRDAIFKILESQNNEKFQNFVAAYVFQRRCGLTLLGFIALIYVGVAAVGVINEIIKQNHLY